ncbi:MAG: cytochrome c oxidase assembly protein [Chloroflexi bacterium]|nr:cytochrome c oxidase assembly protein [Chloroflexota bacterium]
MSVTRSCRRLAGVPIVVATGLAAAGPVPPTSGPVPPDAPSLGGLVLGWSFEPVVLLPLLAVAIWWWRTLDGIDRGHPEHPVPKRQRWALVFGLVAIAVALQSGLARYDTTLFSLHMVQHLLLTMVAPSLLALAAPITQLLRASSPGTRQRLILPVLHSRVVLVIGHPILAWILFAAVMWGSHFSPLFNASLEDPLAHDLEHLAYLTVGLLFWWPVVGLDPSPHRMAYPARIGYAFLQMPLNSFLAMAILFADASLYPHYATLGAPYGIDALSDQRLAAGIMWIFGDLVFLVSTLMLVGAWMRSETRASTRPSAERRVDAEMASIREREAALRLRRATGAGDQAGPADSTSDR